MSRPSRSGEAATERRSRRSRNAGGRCRKFAADDLADSSCERRARRGAVVGFRAFRILADRHPRASRLVLVVARHRPTTRSLARLLIRLRYVRCRDVLALHQHQRFRQGAGVARSRAHGRARRVDGALSRAARLSRQSLHAATRGDAVARGASGGLGAARVGSGLVSLGLRLVIARLFANRLVAFGLGADRWCVRAVLDARGHGGCARDVAYRGHSRLARCFAGSGFALDRRLFF